MLIYLFSIFSLNALAETSPFVIPTADQASAFQQYLAQSGLLKKETKIRKLVPGSGFKIIPKACKDGDDLYFVSFDSGIKLTFPKKQGMSVYYPSGTGGAWTPFFKHDSKTGYFQFVGAETHRWPSGATLPRSDCPDIEVNIHGDYCRKAGNEECKGWLKYDPVAGYQIQYPSYKK